MPRVEASGRVAVIDVETDPFAPGRYPEAFAVEFYCDDFTIVEWGAGCMARMMAKLEKLPRGYTIFAHNGGRFDFSFMIDWIDNPIKIINGRLAKAKLFQHVIRDSFCIMPFSLSKYKKLKIDYALFERDQREKHKDEILTYLHTDCLSLYELVTAFNDRFGNRLTIAGTAMWELQSMVHIPKMNEKQDEYFRQYYFGGRVQCFRGGNLKGPWKMYDINSQYPTAMRNFKHPIGNNWKSWDRMPDNFDKPFFVVFEGTNTNALPSKAKDGLTFEKESGEFWACSHEIKIALEHGLIKIDKVIDCWRTDDVITFEEFVDHFYKEKADAKRNGDKIGEIFAKFILNSAYGKFGQNPRDYEDYAFAFDDGEIMDFINKGEGWRPSLECEKYTLMAKPALLRPESFFDVSIAASITSAARSILLEGLQKTKDVIYCDTDSLICRDFAGTIDPYELGAFKYELTADYCAVAGKKLYTLYNNAKDFIDDDGNKSRFAKVVSKGGDITGEEIIELTKGKEVKYYNPVPTFSFKSSPRFVSRTFRSTLAKSAKSASNV